MALIFCGSSAAFAQSKLLKKDIKKTCKEWKKAGWSLLATASTMEYALTKYRTYVEGDEENHLVLTGIAVGKNPKIGRENAMMNGITSYASREEHYVFRRRRYVGGRNR